MTKSDDKDIFPVLMERQVKFQPSSGEALVNIVIQIGYPKWTEPNIEASCPVAFRGGIGRVRDIRGADPINAMKLAISFVELYMQRGKDEGKFFWNDGEEYFEG